MSTGVEHEQGLGFGQAKRAVPQRGDHVESGDRPAVAHQVEGFGHGRAASRVGGQDHPVLAHPGQAQGDEVTLGQSAQPTPLQARTAQPTGGDDLTDQLAQVALADQLAAGSEAGVPRVEAGKQGAHQGRELAVEREPGQ